MLLFLFFLSQLPVNTEYIVVLKCCVLVLPQALVICLRQIKRNHHWIHTFGVICYCSTSARCNFGWEKTQTQHKNRYFVRTSCSAVIMIFLWWSCGNWYISASRDMCGRVVHFNFVIQPCDSVLIDKFFNLPFHCITPVQRIFLCHYI